MIQRKKTGWIPLIAVFIMVILLILMNYNTSPSAEDLQKFKALKVESTQLESLINSIEKNESDITTLQKKLQTRLSKKEKKILPVQLALLTQNTDSMKQSFNIKLSLYQKGTEEIPKELADSLKIFIQY